MPRKNPAVSQKTIKEVLNITKEELKQLEVELKPDTHCYVHFLIAREIECKRQFKCKTEKVRDTFIERSSFIPALFPFIANGADIEFNIQASTDFGTVISLTSKSSNTVSFETDIKEMANKLHKKLLDEMKAPEITEEHLNNIKDDEKLEPTNNN